MALACHITVHNNVPLQCRLRRRLGRLLRGVFGSRVVVRVLQRKVDEVLLPAGRACLEHADDNALRAVGDGEDALGASGHWRVCTNHGDKFAAVELQKNVGRHARRRVQRLVCLVVVRLDKKGSLMRSADGKVLVRLDATVRIGLRELVSDCSPDFRDFRCAAGENDVGDVLCRETRRSECSVDGLSQLAIQVRTHHVETTPVDVRVEIHALRERLDRAVRHSGRRQRPLRRLARKAQLGQRALVSADVVLVVALEFLRKVIYQSLVEGRAPKGRL
eukprot:Opistho-1_new@48434